MATVMNDQNGQYRDGDREAVETGAAAAVTARLEWHMVWNPGHGADPVADETGQGGIGCLHGR
jgi:hypothetical protein